MRSKYFVWKDHTEQIRTVLINILFTYEYIDLESSHKNIQFLSLKGLFHEMDLAFDDMYC